MGIRADAGAALLDSGEEVELNAALMMILEAFYRGAGRDRVYSVW